MKHFLKMLAASLFTIFVSFGTVILTLYYLPNLNGLCIGLLLGFIVFCIVVFICYPIWFKDYIEEFWIKEEEKKCQEKEVEEKELMQMH